jgi:hypothetical protein
MGQLLLSILFVLAIAPSLSARGWRGIIPLHSTRVEVERLLGKPTGECQCHYETDAEFVRVDYAKGLCAGWPSGWRVPADTVLAFRVGTKSDLRFSDLHIDDPKFWKTYDDAFFAYYANRLEGIQYTVEREGTVRSIEYFPSSVDLNLRCKCFPPDDGSVFRGRPFDSFEGISFYDASARLDNFAVMAQNSGAGWRAHIITYSPLRTTRAAGLSYRNRVRNWLVVKRGLDARKVTVVDGGHREQFGAELYLLPDELTSPPPFPTIGSCDPKRVH